MRRIAVVGAPGGWSSELLADTLAQRTGFRLLLDPRELVLDLEQGTVLHRGQDLAQLDALVVKKAGAAYSPDLLDRLEVLRFLQHRGVRIFSDPERILRMIDRLSCTVTLRLGGIPMPPTLVTEDPEAALAAVERFGRAVFKPLYTSKARGMVVVEAGPEARDEIAAFQDAGNPVMYIQQMVEHMGKDLGVAFLGGKYLATYARAGSEKSWNTTTRSGGMYQPYDPPAQVLELAKSAQDLFGLDFTCVDVVETGDGPMVFEVSAFGGFRGLLEANHIQADQLLADYVLGKLEE